MLKICDTFHFCLQLQDFQPRLIFVLDFHFGYIDVFLIKISYSLCLRAYLFIEQIYYIIKNAGSIYVNTL